MQIFPAAESICSNLCYAFNWRRGQNRSSQGRAIMIQPVKTGKTYRGADKFTALPLYQLTGLTALWETSPLLLLLINGRATGHGLRV